eukprot:6954656-Prymnesium_polylepis.1
MATRERSLFGALATAHGTHLSPWPRRRRQCSELAARCWLALPAVARRLPTSGWARGGHAAAAHRLARPPRRARSGARAAAASPAP